MLGKGKGNAVFDLRAILLFDASFNRNNALCGSQIVASAEKHNDLPWEQCGSRKGHSSDDQSLNKRFTHDFWQLG